MKRLAVLLLTGAPMWAQCVMCFRTAAAQNAARAHVLNMGVLLLGLPPFAILAGFLVLAWRRNRAFADASACPVETTLPVYAAEGEAQ